MNCMRSTTQRLTSASGPSAGTSLTFSQNTCAWVCPMTTGSCHISTKTMRSIYICLKRSVLRLHLTLARVANFWPKRDPDSDLTLNPTLTLHSSSVSVNFWATLCVQLCDTYPRYIYIPATAPTPIVLSSARFRSRGRLPVLSYLHRENQVSCCVVLIRGGQIEGQSCV